MAKTGKEGGWGLGELQEILIRLRGNRPYREIAEKAGISHGYLRTLELGKHPSTGKLVMPSAETLKALAMAYDYPYENLLQAAGYLDDGTSMESSVNDEEIVRIPICSDIRNGRLIIIDYGYMPKRSAGDIPHLFLKVKDDSMIESRIAKHDSVLVRRQNLIPEGSIGVVEILDNGTLIRKVKYDGDDVILTPTNSTYAQRRYRKTELSFIGVVELVIMYIS
jgi:SOS-response transcriptional repressor LexA